ncbi:MAG: DUF3788 domain-containing protein [Brevefilum sp.]|nr:DUF3788 domain-containing protein [Brevefilum sp.]
MTEYRFLDRDVQPSPESIRQIIGREVYPVWEDTVGYLQSEFQEFESELTYYNPQHGWGLRYRKGSQQLCMLFPERGGFTALITLNPEEDEAALGKSPYFNARIRGLLNQPSALPHGRWLWIRIEDHTDFVGLKLLLAIKHT